MVGTAYPASGGHVWAFCLLNKWPSTNSWRKQGRAGLWEVGGWVHQFNYTPGGRDSSAYEKYPRSLLFAPGIKGGLIQSSLMNFG